MANNDDNLIAAVGLDLDSWERGINQMIADERKLERSLDGVTGAANDAEKALNSIDASIDLDVDTGDLEKAKNIAQEIDGIDPNIDFSVDETELETVRRLIQDIDSDAPTVDIVVDETELDAAVRIINDIDTEAPTVDVIVDESEIDDAKRKVEDIDGENPNVDVDVDDAEVTTLLEDIRNLQAIQMVITVTGNVFDVLRGLADIGVGGILELDDAMAHFEGTTGRSAFFLEGLVDTLHGQGIVASITDIGLVAETASQLGIHFQEMDEAAAATFNTIAITGGDAQETLTLINQMVELGLAENFAQASDIIVTGFQTGANRGQDFLDVLGEYGSTFERLGIDGVGAINVINSGLNAGFGNADRVADALREMDIRARELDFSVINSIDPANVEEMNAALGETGAALQELDLLDETEAFLNGELSGDEYFASITEALNEVDNAADRAQLAVAIFGTQAEDIGTEAVTALSTEGELDVEDIEGRAQEAATAITDTIGGAIAEVQQMLSDLATDFFSSESLDLDGKLDTLKAQIQTFVDEVNSGATFGEALEIALDMPGLEDQFHDLEGIVGNLALAITSAFATILDALGQGAAADQLRASIEDMANEQLIFDVQAADNADAISGAVAAAVDRGLDPADIQESLELAFNEALAAGDIDTAQLIVDNINAANAALGELDAGELMQMGEVPVTLTVDTADFQAQIDQAASGVQVEIDAALAAGDIEGAAALAESIGSSLEGEFNRLVGEGQFDLASIIAAGTDNTAYQEHIANVSGMSDESVAEMQANAQLVVDAANETADLTSVAADEAAAATAESSATIDTANAETVESFGEAGLSSGGFAENVEGSMTRVNTAVDAAEANVTEFADYWDQRISELEDVNVTLTATTNITDDPNGSAPGHAAGTSPGNPAHDTFFAGEEGIELISTDTALSVLNNETTESILSGLAALLVGGWTGGGESSITINQQNTFNNNGAAASTASLDQAARGIRGF